MRIDFTDCGVANEAFSAINIDVRGVQLDGGELTGHVEANQCGDAVFMGSFMSHRSLFTGGRMPGLPRFVGCIHGRQPTTKQGPATAVSCAALWTALKRRIAPGMVNCGRSIYQRPRPTPTATNNALKALDAIAVIEQADAGQF